MEATKHNRESEVRTNEGRGKKMNWMLYYKIVSSRARGQSKVEIWATGMVLVYLNSDEANDLYNLVGNLNFVGTLYDGAGLLTVAKPRISYACNVASYVAGIWISSYKAQINQAKSNGTGIIMYVAPMPDGIGSTTSFGAQ